MKSEASIEIERPIEEVFEYTIRKVVEWCSIVVSDEVINETPDMIGTTFKTVTDDRGREMVFDGRVIEHAPPNRHVVEMVGKQFDIKAEYSFEDIDGNTLVTERCEVKGKGFFRFMFIVMGWLMRKASCRDLARELENLKKFAESQGD
jgi:hypothetical protein